MIQVQKRAGDVIKKFDYDFYPDKPNRTIRVYVHSDGEVYWPIADMYQIFGKVIVANRKTQNIQFLDQVEPERWVTNDGVREMLVKADPKYGNDGRIFFYMMSLKNYDTPIDGNEPDFCMMNHDLLRDYCVKMGVMTLDEVIGKRASQLKDAMDKYLASLDEEEVEDEDGVDLEDEFDDDEVDEEVDDVWSRDWKLKYSIRKSRKFSFGNGLTGGGRDATRVRMVEFRRLSIRNRTS